MSKFEPCKVQKLTTTYTAALTHTLIKQFYSLNRNRRAKSKLISRVISLEVWTNRVLFVFDVQFQTETRAFVHVEFAREITSVNFMGRYVHENTEPYPFKWKLCRNRFSLIPQRLRSKMVWIECTRFYTTWKKCKITKMNDAYLRISYTI